MNAKITYIDETNAKSNSMFAVIFRSNIGDGLLGGSPPPTGEMRY